MCARKQYEQFQVHAEGITHKGKWYPFGDMRHIFFARMRTTENVNLVKVGEPETAVLSLTMADGQEIEVSFDERPVFVGWNRDREVDIQNLIDAYVYLSQMTFSTRLSHYEEQIRRQGYFQVDECRFFPPDRVMFRNREFPVRSTDFLKSYGLIELRKKDFRWLDRVKRELSFRKIPQFSTLTDTDVVFHMLDRHSGLRWGP